MRAVVAVAAVFVIAGQAPPRQAPPLPSPRLYVLDCGTLVGRNLRAYGLPPDARDLSVACALVIDGDRSLLWETGLGDQLAGRDTPTAAGWAVTRTLRGQLAEIGVQPAAIAFLAMSHSHADHMGNANDYASSTWLVQEAERDFAFAQRDTSAYRAIAGSRTTILHGDRDVFGDGVATLLSTPGHTPGHQSLLVKLPHSGAILLTGDLYHYPEERAAGTFPAAELDREKTAESRARVESLIRTLHAQVWIEHDILGYARLRKAPEYYD